MINKTVLAITLFTVPFIIATPFSSTEAPVEPIENLEVIKETPVVLVKKEPEINILLDALIQVESKGDSSAIGDTHMDVPSVGVLQIRPIMVREVNRILKKKKSKKRFKLKDRFSRTKSIEMFMIWKDYHHPNGGFEEIARCWNGGPRGIKNKRTEHYWAKVQIELNK